MEITTLDLKKHLKKIFGFEEFRGIQEQVIHSIISGNDTFVIMPTGGGKSMCYQLPALILEGTAIVVSPLIALMKNQVDGIRGYTSEDGVAHVLNSSLNKTQIQTVKDDITNGVTKLLYVAPESLGKEENVEFLRSVPISFYAIDEAHCISEWGHDFRPEYRRLSEIFEEISSKPIIALTATATPKVQLDIKKNLKITDANVFKASFNRPNLYYEVRSKTSKEQACKEIVQFIRNRKGQSGIIYCLSRKYVEEMAEILSLNGINALPYHAGLDAKKRVAHQDAFIYHDVDVIVATIAFGMGIDKPDVRFVIHFEMPKSLESYYQETGRAGRDGGEGYCLSFYDYKDVEKLEKLLYTKTLAEQEIGNMLLQDVVAYAETSMSRRKFILDYFGESFDEKNGEGADMDDNTRFPKPQKEAREEAVNLLETILQCKEIYKPKDLVKIITGQTNALIKSHKNDLLENFGIGKDKDENFWMAMIRQVLVKKYLRKEIEQYGVLKLTEEGKKFISSDESFMMIEERKGEDMEDSDSIIASKANKGSVIDKAFHQLLIDKRKQISEKHNIPPYTIFSDNSLVEMANNYPTSIEELTKISGIGEGKAQKFGKEILPFIKNYVEENDIQKVEEIVVKSIVNKSGLKVAIILSTDKKVPLENIAKSKNISLDDLLNEIERIVYSGTKVNIDYYLNDLLEEDQQEEILDYFMESTSDCLKEAYEEFEGEYDEEELRLMRIKFLSDVAN